MVYNGFEHLDFQRNWEIGGGGVYDHGFSIFLPAGIGVLIKFVTPQFWTWSWPLLKWPS